VLPSFLSAASRYDTLRLLKALSLSMGIPQTRDSVGFGRLVEMRQDVAALGAS